ncbi:hypothetical protein GQ600_8909 [Phytophthora cactorum]|nr:hypothetical protein GQ600_8909 [Phytophthora cactorum]
MQDSSVVVAAQELRCQQFLREGTTSALGEAVSAAHSCLELDKTLVARVSAAHRGALPTAQARRRRYWYKKGLELHPDNAELQAGLKEARVAVLNGILVTQEKLEQVVTSESYIESLSEVQPANESGPRRSTQIVQRAQLYASSGLNEALTNDSKTTVFQAKIERVLEHLDVLKLARMAAVYIFSELLNLRRVTVGIGLFFLGLLAQAIMHRQK